MITGEVLLRAFDAFGETSARIQTDNEGEDPRGKLMGQMLEEWGFSNDPEFAAALLKVGAQVATGVGVGPVNQEEFFRIASAMTNGLLLGAIAARMEIGNE